MTDILTIIPVTTAHHNVIVRHASRLNPNNCPLPPRNIPDFLLSPFPSAKIPTAIMPQIPAA